MVRLKCLALFAIATLGTLSVVHAETLIIDNIDQSREAVTERPKRGMSMDTVESRWGQPLDKRAPVGDPPITRWEYPSFIIYFEYDKVIHAVVKR